MATPKKTSLRRIRIDEVLQRKQQVVFVDARSATALARNPLQVPGAIHLPAKDVGESLKQLPRNRALVTYCT
jgi:rhodanese-related sulfurtransferase